MTNPFTFTYDSSNKKIKFSNDSARQLRVINKVSNNYYLKRVTCYYHILK